MDFNQSPYFDDFDELKQFYRVLFRPGVAVQAREMNQLQSILQDQITKFGNHVFKEGSVVIPGQVTYHPRARYIKLASTNLGAQELSYLEGKEIAAEIDGTGLRAFVVKAIPTDGIDPDTLIVTYNSGNQQVSGGANQITGFKFTADQVLYIVNEPALNVIVSAATSAVTDDFSAVASIQQGVYYLAGCFVSVPAASAVVEKYVTDPLTISAKVGIQYTEEVITESEDNSLTDNASGSLNFAAPGAHRYRISTEFVTLPLDESPEGFVELIRILDGVVLKLQNRALYNVLEDTLARRTYDESGNYVVNDFKFDVREARKNDRSAWKASTYYAVGDYVQASTTGRFYECIRSGTSGGTEPTSFASFDQTSSVTDGAGTGPIWRFNPNPTSNRGLYDPGSTNASIQALASSSDVVLSFGPGKAYVKGYEIDNEVNSFVTLPKARATASSNNITLQTPEGNYIYVDRTRTYGLPDTKTGGLVYMFDRPIFDLSNQYRFGYGRRVGQGRIKFMDYDASGGLKLGLYDVRMDPGRIFDRDVDGIVQFDDTPAVRTSVYNLSGAAKYVGGTIGGSNVLCQYPGAINHSGGATAGVTLPAGTIISVSSGTLGANANFSGLNVGDVVTFNSTSNANRYTVLTINSPTLMTVVGSSITSMIATAASMFVVVPPQTVVGVSTPGGLQTKFLSELRTGDTVRIGANNTGTVTQILSDTRMLLTSVITTATIGVIGVGSANSTVVGSGLLQPDILYQGQTAKFATEVYSNYALGINAKRLTGLFTITDFTGNATTIPAHAAIRLTGTTDARLSLEARAGDLISINDQRMVLTYISSNSVGFAIRPDSTTVGSTTAQYPIIRINNSIIDPDNDSLVYRAADAVRSMRNNVYEVYTTVLFTAAAGTSSFTFTLSAGTSGNNTDQLATNDPNYFLLARRNEANLANPIRVVSVTAGGGGVVTVNLAENLVSAGNYTLLYPVRRTANDPNAELVGGRRTKTLVLDANTTFLTSSTAQRSTLTLNNTDVYRLNKVLMLSSFQASWPATYTAADVQDITENYDFDNGQRSAYYDYSSLKLKSGRPVPTGSVRVFYDYFSHSAGDYFAYNSYDNDFVPYEQAPTFNGVNLKDCLDFRPSVDSADFEPPRFGTGFLTNITYYLGRKNKVLLDQNGTFYTVASASSLNPATPEYNNENCVQLYDLTLEPYTRTAGWPSITTKKIDNRRYTMKDIGGIDKRLENLEITTALSLLETNASSLQIRDNNDPTLERYKTGFFVDNFGDTSNADFQSGSTFSVDFQNQVLYPHITDDGFVLREKISAISPTSTTGEIAAINGVRSGAGSRYRVTGDLLTLDYSTTPVVQQLLATTSLSVTPFLKLLFQQTIDISPDSDIYVNPVTINNIVSENTAVTQQQAINNYRATGDWRPYRIEETITNTLLRSETVSELIPFCRAQTIVFKMKGMKPRAEHYVFFDDFDVGDYCQGAVKMTFTALETLDVTTSRPNAGTAGEWGGYARWRSGAESYTVSGSRRTHYPTDYDDRMPSTTFRDQNRKALSRGAVVLMYETVNGVITEVGSGIIVHQEGATAYIVNGRGKLSAKFIRANATTNGGAGYNYSGATFRVGVSTDNLRTLSNPTSITPANVCTDSTAGTFFSDDKGNLIILMDLPDQDGARFITGRKPIVIVDDSSNTADNWDSRATGTYTVEGFTVTTTNSFHSTKTFRAVPYDPIAQSFKLPDNFGSGAFITDVDIFFAQKPEAERAPIRLEIRPCDLTGRPSGSDIIPGSVVTKYPEEITVDASGRIATKFTFEIPVYLLPDQYYAVCLKSDSVYYKVWIATLGGFDINEPNKMHNFQTLFGSLFKSQDGSLWTEDQFSDLKFRVNRAVFNAGTPATAYVVNEPLPGQNLATDPFLFTHSSTLVRVAHPNHGLRNGDFVRFGSEYWRTQYQNAIALNTTATFPGVNVEISKIFGNTLERDQVYYDDTVARFQVSEVTLNSYVIDLVDTVADLGVGSVSIPPQRATGGNDVIGYGNLQYHVAVPGAKVMNFQETSLSFDVDTVKGITYDFDNNSTDYSVKNDGGNINVATVFDEPKVILNPINEALKHPASRTYTNGETWQHSYVGKFTLNSTSDQVSPVIDLSTLYVRTITHNVNNPTAVSRLYNGGSTLPALNSSSAPVLIKQVITANNTAISFDSVTSSISATAGTFSALVPGSYIVTTGDVVSGYNMNSSTGYLVTGISADGGTAFLSGNVINVQSGFNITVTQLSNYVDEIGTSFGSVQNKYCSKKINLTNPASQLKMIFQGSIPHEADFDIYYKTGPATADFTLRPWTKFNQLPTINKTTKRNDFTEFTVDITDFDSLGNPRDLPSFTAFQVKIVMRTTNGGRVPQFKNLRVIAHA
jgi:hypothetical protein